MDSTPVRPSQFVTRDGPGSLMPSAGSSILIPSITHIVEFLSSGSKGKDVFNEPDIDGKRGLDKFVITDGKMERLLKQHNSKPDKPFDKEIKVFRLPTNDDLGVPTTQPVLTGYIFPKWGLCTQHNGTPILMEYTYENYNIILKCPLCEKNNLRFVRGSAIRFVQACSNGHLQDLYWPGLVHAFSKECQNKIFSWKELGGGDNFVVQCIKCRKSVSYLGKTGLKARSVNGSLKCNGQFPEADPKFNPKICESAPADAKSKFIPSRAKLIQKNSAGLHSGKMLSSIYIPKFAGVLYTGLYNIRRELSSFTKLKPDWTKFDLKKHLEEIKDDNQIPTLTIAEVDSTEEGELANAVSYVLDEMKKDANQVKQKPITETEANNEELNSLLEAAREGFPPDPEKREKRAFVNISDIITVKSKEFGLTFRITPIRNIQVTRTQIGYSREIAGEKQTDATSRIGKLVRQSCYHDDGNTRWYLGDQMFGEALFIDIVSSEDTKVRGGLDPISSKNFDDLSIWSQINENRIKEQNELDENDAEYEDKTLLVTNTNTRFVWWHSFCHNLLQNLSIDSGFSLVSLGERVYCHQKNDGGFESGILIYTAATGSDGTLGGLVSLVEKTFMTGILRKTAESINSCSNDPVCSDIRINKNKVTGACCHACELISETTCGYQNKFLDRNIVRGTLEYD